MKRAAEIFWFSLKHAYRHFKRTAWKEAQFDRLGNLVNMVPCINCRAVKSFDFRRDIISFECRECGQLVGAERIEDGTYYKVTVEKR